METDEHPPGIETAEDASGPVVWSASDVDPERLRGVAVPAPPHSIFDRFPCWEGDVDPGWDVNFLGIRTRVAFFSLYEELGDFSQRHHLTTTAPVQNEDYFEWIDLLESVVDSRTCFKMIELGAGWGRWLAAGAAAARQVGLDYHLIGVEADPGHFAWMKRHFLDNDIALKKTERFEAAVAGEEGAVWFHTGDSSNWYGQRIADEQQSEAPAPVRSRFRRRKPADTVRQISAVRAISLNNLLQSDTVVDLIDADIQGSEAAVFEASRDRLERVVRRVHIGTHSLENESRLRALFETMGWESIYDFPSNQRNETPYGTMVFQDGIQSWRNPRLQREAG
jgi:FkbM family methyltransferase